MIESRFNFNKLKYQKSGHTSIDLLDLLNSPRSDRSPAHTSSSTHNQTAEASTTTLTSRHEKDANPSVRPQNTGRGSKLTARKNEMRQKINDFQFNLIPEIRYTRCQLFIWPAAAAPTSQPARRRCPSFHQKRWIFPRCISPVVG